MKDLPFPIEKTIITGAAKTFQLEDPVERKQYFALKAGSDIERIQAFLEGNTFVAFFLGKKNSGKGTYSKLFMEAVGAERAAHISVGDVVRDAKAALSDPEQSMTFKERFQEKYRGFVPFEDVVNIVVGHDQKTLLPTEAILALVEMAIDQIGRKAIFVDGFPRNLDQVSISLYFRALMGYRADPDFFIFIDIPEAVIDERMKYRVICPVCKTPRNLKLLRTKQIGYDEEQKQFYLMCDNDTCGNARMVPKIGDDQGIESIRDRIQIDHEVMKTLLGLHGVPKVYLRNCIPAGSAKDFVDAYEITPSYEYSYDPETKAVSVEEKPWIVNDDDGVPSHSLLPAAVAVSLIRQISSVLGLKSE